MLQTGTCLPRQRCLYEQWRLIQMYLSCRLYRQWNPLHKWVSSSWWKRSVTGVWHWQDWRLMESLRSFELCSWKTAPSLVLVTSLCFSVRMHSQDVLSVLWSCAVSGACVCQCTWACVRGRGWGFSVRWPESTTTTPCLFWESAKASDSRLLIDRTESCSFFFLRSFPNRC